jgi:beta-galactosidase
MQRKITYHNNFWLFCLDLVGHCLRSVHQTITSYLLFNIKVPLIFSFVCFSLACGPATAQQTHPADAALSVGKSLNWDQSKEEIINSKRTQVTLDGIWRFMPATKGEMQPSKFGWNYIKVPGSWQGSKGGGNRNSGRGASPLLGTGPQWTNFDGSKVDLAWYERQVLIPAHWQKRNVSLRFDRVSTDAIVYVNGKECGKVSWPWGAIDITGAVKPGQMANVQVLVVATPDAGMVGNFWQNAFMEVTYNAAQLATRGLIGSVYLESRLSNPHVTDIFVRTSTRKKEVALDVELTGVKQAGSVHLVAEMLDEKNKVEKRFEMNAMVDGKDVQQLTVSWPWTDPRTWDLDHPNLYTLRLAVSGSGLDDQYNQPFGFREFWVDGRQFYLNGSVIHLRQRCFYNGQFPQVGDNFSEFGNTKVDTRGDSSDAGLELNRCDHIGYLAAVYVLDANKYIRDPRGGKIVWGQNQELALKRTNIWMRHYRNHPSVITWIAGMNFFNEAVDADPRNIGRRGWVQNDPRWERLLAAGNDLFNKIKKLDTTRAYYSHSGAYTGDIYTMNLYLNLIPLQEREDWLSQWSQDGDMPISMVEFGTPVDCSFRRGHQGFTSNITSEPLLTEWAAIYFGSEAYLAEEPKYRKYLHELFKGGMLYNSSENQLDDYENNHKIQQLYRVNTARSWRTAGLGGGLRTWSWMQDALKEINYPTLAWIAGKPEAYTAKDHNFNSRQNVQKQIVLINDTRQPQDFIARWTITVGGKTTHQGELHGRLAISEIRKVPMDILMPNIKTGDETEGEIMLKATIGEAIHEDKFAFRVFGKVNPARGEIMVVDPEGLTSKMLKKFGYNTRAWNGRAKSLVVVGRNALKENPAIVTRLESFVRTGGRLLIFAQDPDWMQQALGLRLCPKVTRNVFTLQNSPVTQGMDDTDLNNWTGESTLIEAKPKYKGDYLRGNEGEQPYAGWHWGNRGGVSSAPIEKPHRSGWTPLLECEFDLAYTPLMELNYGRGRMIVCTLDLEDHAALDPGARLVAGRIIEYAQHAPLIPRASKVIYLGNDKGAMWLDKIGVNYKRSGTLDKSAGLVLIGADVTIDQASLNAYLKQGGKVFFLPRTQAGPLGITLKPAVKDFAGSRSVPDWPETKGLSMSDLRWRSYPDALPYLLGDGAEIVANGLLGRKIVNKGVAVFCQIDPDGLNADEKTYLRYTRWRAIRTVAQLLANLGASFAVDSMFFHPLKPELNPNRMWIAPSGDISGIQATPHIPDGLQAPASAKLGYYCPDYRTDFEMGDNPYRYYRF